MAIDDDHYVLDDDGNRVLVGLDPKETLEFETLEKFFSVTDLMSRPSSDDRRSSKEQQRCTFSFSRGQSWSRLSEQDLRVDKWRVCRG